MDIKAEQPAHSEDVYNTPRKRGGAINTLYPPGSQPGAKGRLRNHCRKFWWCDCLVLAVLILIIVLPIIFVAVPHKAQHEINASTLEVMSQEVTNPQADSVHLKLDTLIKSSSSYHPTVDAFRAGLTLEGQKEPFLYVNVPAAKSDAETKITIDQDVKFASTDAFTAYTKAVLGAETFKVHLDGKPKIHLKGLPAMKVNYNKVVTMKGLNKLSGLNITSLTLLPSLTAMTGTILIPNPSVMTLDLGNVTMNLLVDTKLIGYALLPNLMLKPGDNNVPMQAQVNPTTVIGLITTKYKNAVLPLDVVGNSSVKGNMHLTYYEEAIRANNVRVMLDVGPALRGAGVNVTGS